MKIIGIAGTAKNTGKTTTLVEAIRFFHNHRKDLFITGIGFDGEDFDNITGLPKPRVFIPEGTIVATALPLLHSSPAQFEVLKDTGIRCALGRIFLGRATVSERVVLAGPASTKDLSSVVALAAENSVVLLDGAFSRISPMVVADSLILATGAAKTRDSHEIASQLNIIGSIMYLPVVGDKFGNASYDNRLIVSGGLFLPGQGQELAWRINGNGKIDITYVSGIINPSIVLETFKEMKVDKNSGWPNDKPFTIVFEHPIMLLLSGDLPKWKEVFQTASKLGLNVKVGKSASLLGATINPYTPIRSEKGKYIATYVPPESFLEDISRLSTIPCTDIVFEGPEKLHSWLKGFL